MKATDDAIEVANQAVAIANQSLQLNRQDCLFLISGLKIAIESPNTTDKGKRVLKRYIQRLHRHYLKLESTPGPASTRKS